MDLWNSVSREDRCPSRQDQYNIDGDKYWRGHIPPMTIGDEASNNWLVKGGRVQEDLVVEAALKAPATLGALLSEVRVHNLDDGGAFDLNHKQYYVD